MEGCISTRAILSGSLFLHGSPSHLAPFCIENMNIPAPLFDFYDVFDQPVTYQVM